jgi:uncharacterized membrane protein
LYWGHLVVGAGFILAGVLHFVLPAPYLTIMPPALPYPLALVYLSGAAEIIGGVGMLIPSTRRAAGIWLILLLIAIFPANVQMLLSWRADGVPAWKESLAWLRLPLQAVLIWWVWRLSRRT